MSEPVQIKVVIIGEASVGKSSILVRFIADSYVDSGSPTLGVAFLSRTLQINGISVKMNIWDTAGQERFGSLAKIYSRDANVIILVYDITNINSFEKMKNWYASLKDEKFDEEVIFAIAGNKEDLSIQETVPFEEVSQFAKSINAIFIKVSAKLNIGIAELFHDIGEKYIGYGTCKENDAIVLSQAKPSSILKKRKKCC